MPWQCGSRSVQVCVWVRISVTPAPCVYLLPWWIPHDAAISYAVVHTTCALLVLYDAHAHDHHVACVMYDAGTASGMGHGTQMPRHKPYA